MGSDEIRSLPPADVQASFCRALVRQWRAQGVSHAFIAPGSRSTPLAIALADDPSWTLEVFLDERSAAFGALGFGLATGLPAVALCTSGTAAVHFHAAVVEADLSCVPMIVVTADRPPELRDVGAPQTIDQTKLFGSSARWFHDPGVASAEAAGSWRSLAARVFNSASGSIPGPVHLNLPFREPLLGRPIDVVPDDEVIDSLIGEHRLSISDESRLLAAIVGRRGVIVAGRGAGTEVTELARSLAWPLLADARSVIQDGSIRYFDSLLRHEGFASSHRPEVVLRFGEPPASKVLGQWITSSGAQQIHVTSHDRWIDADHRMTLRVLAECSSVCSSLATRVEPTPPSWLDDWQRADGQAARAVAGILGQGRLTGAHVARMFASQLPKDSHLVVSSSMPIRDLEWFAGSLPHLTVHSNRGANGIDGVIATAIGVAVATGRPTGLLIGDVAFVHDSSSLAALAGRAIDLRIMVVDNDGGGIFHFLPQAAAIGAETFEQLFGTPHRTDLVSLARAHSIRSTSLVDGDGISEFAQTPGTSVGVVRTDRQLDVEQHRAIHAAVAESVASDADQR